MLILVDTSVNEQLDDEDPLSGICPSLALLIQLVDLKQCPSSQIICIYNESPREEKCVKTSTGEIDLPNEKNLLGRHQTADAGTEALLLEVFLLNRIRGCGFGGGAPIRVSSMILALLCSSFHVGFHCDLDFPAIIDLASFLRAARCSESGLCAISICRWASFRNSIDVRQYSW